RTRRRAAQRQPGHGVGDDHRRAGEGLETAAVAALTLRAMLIHRHVAELASEALAAGVDTPAHDQPAADAGASLDGGQHLYAAAGAEAALAQRAHVGIVAEIDRHVQLAAQDSGDIDAVPAWHARRCDQPTAGAIHWSGDAHANPQHTIPGDAARGGELANLRD